MGDGSREDTAQRRGRVSKSFNIASLPLKMLSTHNLIIKLATRFILAGIISTGIVTSVGNTDCEEYLFSLPGSWVAVLGETARLRINNPEDWHDKTTPRRGKSSHEIINLEHQTQI